MRKHLHRLQDGTHSGPAKPIIWTGDLNVAYFDYDVYDGATNSRRALSPGFTPGERKRFGVLLEEGLVDTYMSVNKNIQDGAHWTFWSMRFNMKDKNKGWRLDYFLVSPELLSSVKDIQ